MIRARLAILFTILLALPCQAAAQLQAPNRVEVVERVDAACPGLILQDHAFTDAVATLLEREDPRWGRNGKRGNPNDPSHDAVAYRNQASPFGVSIVDIIGAAGSPSASPAWIDQTQATINERTTGVWVQPSRRLPPCLMNDAPPPGPGPGPGTRPPVAPSPIDLSPILAALAAINERLLALEAHQTHTVDWPQVNEYIDMMVGRGPGGDAPNHITDMKERLDKVRALLEELFAWLRGRRALSF